MRTYERTHPWLTFRAALDRADPRLWLLLGEARSKCEHIARVPLPPVIAMALHRLYLAKGMQGTAAIEGNTLTLEQVEQHLKGELRLPPSQRYLQTEIDNIVNACSSIASAEFHDQNPLITPDLLNYFNRTVLEGLDLEPEVVPGEVREHSVTVLRYLGAPAEDCPYLIERLCEWLNSDGFATTDDYGLAVPILKAIIAHLYIAWIHPYGDGNGRTARLMEVYILVHAGVPTPAAHLLSNHYHLTRAAYYKELDRASKSAAGDPKPFILYALNGFVDQLRQQVEVIQIHQVNMAWGDFVNERFEGKHSAADIRRKRLLLTLSWAEPMRRQEMLALPNIAADYSGKTIKTLTRDLNELISEGLAERLPSGYRACPEQIFSFLPPRFDQERHLLVTAQGQLELNG